MNTIQPTTQQRGTGMIEVMVAAVIIGIGLLGIAALQAGSMQASSGAALRARASDLASEMIERVRANAVADNCYCTPACLAPAQLANDCATDIEGRTHPSAFTMAMNNDLAVINAAVAAELPNGNMTISCNDKDAASPAPDNDPCTEGSTMFVTIGWSTQTDTIGQGQTDRIIAPFIPGAP
jgi:type IV pilus assembly protein PilV